jgi:hypothetical protein
MKRFIFLLVFIFIIFSCSKNNKEKYVNEEKHELTDITEKDSKYSDEEIFDKEIYEKLLGNWDIFEINGKIIFKDNVPRDSNNTLGFKRDYFYQYYDGGGMGGWKLEWRIEKGKLYITKNNPDDDIDMYIGYEIIGNYSGSYNVEFFNEKIIILYHENGNIYKCSKYGYPECISSQHKETLIETINKLDSFIKNKSNLNIRYTYDTTLLMSLIYYSRGGENDPSLALHLLEKGVDINETNMFGQTALHYAAWAMMPKLIEKLIEMGADVNLVDGFGQTPLDIAELFSINDKESIWILKSHGAINNKK